MHLGTVANTWLTNCNPKREGKKPRPAWKCTCPPTPPPSTPPAPNPPQAPPIGPPMNGLVGRLSACGRSASGRLGTPSTPADFVLFDRGWIREKQRTKTVLGVCDKRSDVVRSLRSLGIGSSAVVDVFHGKQRGASLLIFAISLEQV